MDYIFSKRVLNINPSLIGQLSIWANKVKGVNKSFGQGIPSEDLPNSFKEKLVGIIKTKDEINKYTLKSGLAELREEIVKDIKRRRLAEDISIGEIGITAGCIGALFSTILTLVEKGDEVIIFSPAYPPHIEIVKAAEGRPIFVPLIEKENWKPDIEKLENSITKKTKAVIICNPSNPTGYVFSREELKKLIKITSKKNIFIISDETYDFLTYGKIVHHSLLSFKEAKDRIISCFGFSKRFFMTGFRIGFVVANEKIINQIFKIHNHSNICVSSFSQFAAFYALQDEFHKDFEILQKNFLQKREIAVERMDKLPKFFKYQPPQGAYYLFPEIKFQNFRKRKISEYLKAKIREKMKSIDGKLKSPDFEFCLELLYGAKVLTIPGIIFGPQGKNHLRISFGGKIEQINDGFDRIEEYLK